MTDTSNSLTPEQIAELKRRRDERQGQVIDFNTQRNIVLETDTTDDAAYDLKKSQELGIPREAIGGAREEYRAEDTLRKMQEMRQAAPKTSEWLTQPDNYAVAKEDADSLSQLEVALKKVPPTKQQYALGSLNITPAVEMAKGVFRDPKRAVAEAGDAGRSFLSAAPMTVGSVSSGLGTWLDSAITFNEKQIIGSIPGATRVVDQAKDWEARFWARHPEVAKAITPYAGPSAILKTYGAEGKKIQAAWQPADMGFEDKVAQGLGQVIVQVGLAMATGGTSVGAGISTGSFMAMGADQQAESLKAAGLNPDEYFGQLSAGAAITGSAEMMRLNSIMKVLPPAMRDRVTKSVVSRIASQAFEEGAQEAIEGVLHNVVTMSYDPRATILGGVAEAGAVGGTVGGLFQGLIELITPGKVRGGTAVQLDKLMADLAREETEIAESADEKALADTIARVGKMKLTGLSPEKAAEAIGKITEGTGVETVTVDLDGAVEALQQAGIDPVEALASLGVTEEQLGQRFERFGEIEVSTATLLTSPLMRGNAAIMTPHLRTGADQYTPAKKEVRREEVQTLIKDSVARIQDAMAGGQALAEKEQAVVDRVTERLAASGMFPERRILEAQVAVAATQVNVFAARIGMDPVEFYEQHFPKVQGSIDGMVMEENALEQSWFKGFGKKQDQGPRTQDTISREIKDIEKKLRRKGYTLNEAETLAEEGTLPPELRGLMIQHGDLVRESGRMQGAAVRAKGGVETDPEYLRAESELNKAMDDVANAEYEIALELREKGLTWEGDDAEFMGVVDQLRREGKLSNYISSRVQDLRDASTRMFDAQEKMQARVKAFAPPESYPVNTGQAPVVPGFRALSPEEKAAFRPSQGFDPARKRMTQDTDALEQERRGQFSPDTDTTTLFEQSDVTTMLHEGAHWYLDLVEKMAKAPDPHPFVVEQYQAVQKWYEGVKNTPALKAARLNYRIQQQGSSFVLYEKDGAKEKLRGRFASQAEAEARIDWIEMHETWAETFEVYIQTGKAPTSALRDTFRAFKTWITALWKRMYGGGQPARANLNPEVIAIMDRMLAVDEEIEAEVAGIMVGAQAQAKALLDAKVITQAQYDKALANLDEAREKAKEDFGARVMADKMREDEAWWNTEKRRVRGDVVRELDRSPIGRALSWLGYGTWKGDVPTSEAPGDGEGEFFQSIRKATSMSEEDASQWFAENVTETRQDMGGDETIVQLQFKTEDGKPAPDANIRIQFNRATGTAKADLFLGRSLGKAVDGPEALPTAMRMFSRAILSLRVWTQLEGINALMFSGATESHDRLYQYMLSNLEFSGYSAFNIANTFGTVRTSAEGEMTGDTMFGASSFILLKDGQRIEDYAKEEINKGRRTAGASTEVVNITRIIPMGRPDRRAGRGMGAGGLRDGADDRGRSEGGAGGAVDNSLGQSAAPIQSRPLRIQGTGPGGRVLNRDLGKALTDRHMKKYGRALDPADPADYKIILKSMLEDFREQSAQQDTGDAWYTDDINEAISLTAQIYPELSTSPTFRDLFLTVTALLSPQQKPVQNWENAILAMRSWSKTGRIEVLKPSGKQYGVLSHTTGLKMFQHLIDTIGLEAALQWVQTEHTGREIAEMRMASGLFSPIDKATGKVSTKVKDYLASETNLNESILGIYGFGPKVGDFMQNSVGIDQNAVTVDLWLARTYNRLIGRLMDVSPGQAEQGAIASEIRGRAEREHIKRLVRDAAKKAGLDPSAMQAALWYFEQRLYRAHGIKSDSQNFSGAARTALQKREIDVPAEGNQRVAGQDAGEGAGVGGDGRGSDQGRGLAPLEGAPRNLQGPIPELVAVAERYARDNGIPFGRQAEYAEVDPERAARIAQAYEDMQHAPNDPAVQEAYADLIRQTRAQYDALVEAGYVFTFFDGASDPYAGNPAAAMRDLRNNKRMAVYGTYDGYGTEGITAGALADNPMLADTGLQWADQAGVMRPVVANDLFRAVHDAMGHGLEGAGFRARGEENAWQAHVRLFTGPAVGAITSETRGQNSWLNYGPYGETNRTATVENTVFAEQKTGLMPEWTWTEGRVPDMDGGAVDNSLGQEAPASPFYSQLQRVIERSATTRAPASQWLGIIRNAPGVKAEEVEWTGVQEYLEAQDGPVTREALAAFLAGNGVQVEEVLRGGEGVSAEAQRKMLPLIEERDRVSRAFSDFFNRVDVQNMAPEEADEYNQIQSRLSELNDEIRNLQRTIDLGLDDAMNDTKWSSYTLPGGENYREMLLTLPKRQVESLGFQTSPEQTAFESRMADKYGGDFRSVYSMLSGSEIEEHSMLVRISRQRSESEQNERYRSQNFTSSHWSEPNVLAHVRFKERTGPNGERVLALEEVQSDWHQAGRERGYKPKGEPPSFEDWYAGNGMALFGEPFDQLDARAQGMARQRWEDATRRGFTGAIPDAPFKNNAWAELVLKRMIRWAADNGFDSVAWIPGNVQNGRVVEDTGDNRGDFYDKILPNIANKLGKKYGARVERAALGTDRYPFVVRDGSGIGQGSYSSRREAEIAIENILAGNFEDAGVESGVEGPFTVGAGRNIEFHSLPLTDALRTAAISEGFPLFQPGDPKGWGETAPPPNLPPMRLDLAETERLYGKEAVAKLPKAIRDRGRDQTSIDSMFAIARATAKTLRRKPPKSLFQFIRSRKVRTVEGKTVPVKQWGIRGAADELKAMDRADLINEENGIHIDYMRELAEEAGYLSEGSTVNDMLNAIDREARGEPVYSSQDQNEVLDYQNAEEWANWFDEQGVDINDKDEKALRAKLAKVVTSTAADAVTPDQAAELLGFNTGEELLAALAEIGNRERFIKAETDRRMAAEFGDPYKDGTFAEAARQAAEIEVKARAAEIELEALARAVGESAASKMAKQMAEESLSLMTVKELAGWTKFLDAERRHGRNALAATKKGDMAEAMLHKRRQLVSMHLARAAREKSEALEKTRKDLMSYLTSKGRRDKIARDYLDKIEALLDQYELRVSKQGPGTQRARLSAKQYVEQMIADGREAEIAPEAMLLAEMADAKVWRDLLAEEADYLAGAVRNIAHLGRVKNRLMRAQEKRRFDAVVAELEATLDAAPSSRDDRAQSFTTTTSERAMTWLRKAHARLTRLEFQFVRLDGKENGALVNALWKPFAEAGDVETERMRGAAEAMNDLYSIFTPAERNALFHRRVATPELKVPGKGLTLMDVVVIGLNYGNEGNRKALADGYGWDPAAIEAVLDRVLTDKHWQFISGVWDLIGSYRADAFALHKAITGVEPKAVEGITFTLPSGRVVKGQYYPLKYAADQPRADSVRQARLDEKQALSEMGKSFSKPMTKTGHLIERVGSGGKPVMLSIGVFHEHVANVIHDIAYRRAIIDANKIITNPRFANAYIRAAGREQYDQLLPWLAQIANERKQEPGGYVTDIMRGARKNFSIMAMGLKIGTAVQQTTGILQGIPLIGTRYATQGFVKAFAGGPGMFWSSWKWVSEKSELMRDRPMGFDRDVREVTNKLQERTPLGPIQRNAFILIGLMDTAVSTSVWIGAYDKAMDGNTPGITKGDEEAAIAYADSVVRRSQVAGRMQDLPAMMRGTELEKLMTVVYSYYSALFNETASQIMRVRGGQLHPLAFTGNMTILYIIVPLMASTLAGRLFDDDDEEELGVKAAKEVASNAVSTIPFVRDVINATINPQFGYQLSPAGSIIEGGTKATANLATGEGFSSEYATRQSLNLLGLLFGLPTGQMFITGDYIYDYAVGDEDPLEDPADAASEALLRSTR